MNEPGNTRPNSIGATLTAVYVVDPHPYLGIGDTNPMGLHAYLSTAREHAAAAHAQVAALCGAAPPVKLVYRKACSEREAHHIVIEVEGGVLALKGKVHTLAEHDAAVGAAFSTHGVSRVVDHLKITA